MSKISYIFKERSIANIIWLMSDSILRLGMGFIINVWLARYLGPSEFGSFNYAFAMIAIYSAVASLGMNGVVVRELVKGDIDNITIMGTSFVLQVIGSLSASVLVIFTVMVLRPGESTLMLTVICMLPSVIFRSSDIIKYWFESTVSSKYTVISQNVAFFISAFLKILIISCGGSYYLIAITVSIEAFLLSVLLFFFYRKKNKQFQWRFNYAEAKRLLNISWPLVLSGVALMLYMRIDQIMIGNIIGDAAVGIYSVAVKMVEVWYFIPVAIVSSLFPKIIKLREQSIESYDKRLQFLYDILVIIGVTLALTITFVSDYIISLLYDHHYFAASKIIKLYAWVSIFYFLSSASGRWYINEGLQKFALTRNLAGLAIGIILNYMLIPKYGAEGSVYATLIAFGCAGYLFDALSTRTRYAFIQKTKSLWLPGNICRLISYYKGK
ncbi:flippase [Enterobacter sp. JUb54]|uniref:flippase n=1 Tax=Enterobacteriaceae TaxID=543 RepID=UPI00164DF7E2|nr:flippase [Enterobacter sp. JUb54]QNK08295.1 flippase [Enterobacter sp. JUb54]